MVMYLGESTYSGPQKTNAQERPEKPISLCVGLISGSSLYTANLQIQNRWLFSQNVQFSTKDHKEYKVQGKTALQMGLVLTHLWQVCSVKNIVASSQLLSPNRSYNWQVPEKHNHHNLSTSSGLKRDLRVTFLLLPQTEYRERNGRISINLGYVLNISINTQNSHL